MATCALCLRGRVRLLSMLTSDASVISYKLPPGQIETARRWPSYCRRRDTPTCNVVGQGTTIRPKCIFMWASAKENSAIVLRVMFHVPC